METRLETLQNDILRILDVIEIRKAAQEHFLGIIGVMFGREHPEYSEFLDMCKDSRKQAQMLKASETQKYKQHFQVLCHIVLQDFIKQVTKAETEEDSEGPKNKIPEKDILLEDYFKEIEKASQYSPSLAGFDKNRFTELKNLEHSLLRRIFPHNDDGDPITETEFTSGNYRQLLTVWLMYPQLIFFPERIQEIINLCKTGKIKI